MAPIDVFYDGVPVVTLKEGVGTVKPVVSQHEYRITSKPYGGVIEELHGTKPMETTILDADLPDHIEKKVYDFTFRANKEGDVKDST